MFLPASDTTESAFREPRRPKQICRAWRGSKRRLHRHAESACFWPAVPLLYVYRGIVSFRFYGGRRGRSRCAPAQTADPTIAPCANRRVELAQVGIQKPVPFVPFVPFRGIRLSRNENMTAETNTTSQLHRPASGKLGGPATDFCAPDRVARRWAKHPAGLFLK